MLSSQLAAKAHIAGSDAIRVGLIGCGGRGTGAAVQALSTTQNVKLVAMADAFEDRLQSSLKYINEQYQTTADGDMNAIADRVDVAPEHQFVGFDAYKKVLPLVDVVIHIGTAISK